MRMLTLSRSRLEATREGPRHTEHQTTTTPWSQAAGPGPSEERGHIGTWLLARPDRGVVLRCCPIRGRCTPLFRPLERGGSSIGTVGRGDSVGCIQPASRLPTRCYSLALTPSGGGCRWTRTCFSVRRRHTLHPSSGSPRWLHAPLPTPSVAISVLPSGTSPTGMRRRSCLPSRCLSCGRHSPTQPPILSTPTPCSFPWLRQTSCLSSSNRACWPKC